MIRLMIQSKLNRKIIDKLFDKIIIELYLKDKSEYYLLGVKNDFIIKDFFLIRNEFEIVLKRSK